MHISEGVLAAPIWASGAGLSAVGVALGLRRMDYESIPRVAVLSAVFFVASLIHVPIGPSAAHLVLNGLCGILLGWAAFPAILVGLSLQAVMFQYGGLTTLGINTLIMAGPAVLAYYACRRALNNNNSVIRGIAEFAAGAGAILMSGLLVAVCLALTGDSFKPVAKLIVLVHTPVMILEGLIAVFIIEFLRRVKPELLPPEMSPGRILLAKRSFINMVADSSRMR